MEANFSDVGICNSGLLKVGAYPISSFNDNTRASNICKSIYAILRDEVTRACPWRFALEQVILATPNAATPPFDYSSAYDVPSNVLRVWRVNVDQWTEVGNQVLCNKPDGINVLAIIQQTDTTQFDAQFAEALAYKLAMNFALALVQSVQLEQEMAKGYKEALATARSSNAVIGTPERLVADFWSGSRRFFDSGFSPLNAGPPENYGP